MTDLPKLKALYEKHVTNRRPYLTRARDCALLTVPALLPPEGHTDHSTLYQPFQSLGARGTNNLSSKMMLSVLPPNAPFFRFVIDDFELEKLAEEKGMRGKVETAFNKMERALMVDIDQTTDRVSVAEMMKLLIVTGNALVYHPPGDKESLRIYRLDKYVVSRDASGNVLEIVVQERIAASTLNPDIRSHCGVTKEDLSANKDLDIYTGIVRVGNEFQIRQEIKDVVVPESTFSYPLDKCPWIALRLIKMDGEDYGRSYVEEYLGDLRSLEGLTQAIVEGSAAAAKIVFLVDPNGMTKADVLEAPNGSSRPGRKQDVTAVQLEKFNDFRVALETINKIAERLSYAFLLNSAVQRSGERVTAEEIRYMANELDDALGGIYSILAVEFQLPYVRLKIDRLTTSGRLPQLPRGKITPTITTGLQALGRGHDLARLREFFEHLTALGQAAQNNPYINLSEGIKRIAAATNVDPEGLIRTDDEVAASQEQTQQMGLLEKVSPELVKQAGGMMQAQQ